MGEQRKLNRARRERKDRELQAQREAWEMTLDTAIADNPRATPGQRLRALERLKEARARRGIEG